MPGDLLIRRARVILPDRVLENADVLTRGGTIAAVSQSRLGPHDGPTIDAEGLWLLPGLVDVHCDAIEKEAQPRPGVQLPFEMALRELDRKLALCGITTMYHGVSFGAGEGVRSNAAAAELVRTIARFGQGSSLVRHQAHVRLEVSNHQAIDLVAKLIDERCVGLLSFMDHTPGQGQYRDHQRYREYVRKTYWVGEQEIDRIVREKAEGRARVRDEDLDALAARARAAWITVAGHDPDTSAAVDRSIALGATLLEFPILLDVGLYARRRGVHVCVGAPNVLHGRSHDGNLSAREAIAAGAADVLCSDYYPSGLLPAVFRLASEEILPFPQAVGLATGNAAASVGLTQVAGTLEQGARADMLLVSAPGGQPTVEVTVVGGQVVLTANGRRVAPPARAASPILAAALPPY